jgi:hypothetical protein
MPRWSCAKKKGISKSVIPAQAGIQAVDKTPRMAGTKSNAF